MCGRFTLTPENVEYVMETLGVERDAVFEERYRPRFNFPPMDPHWIVVQEGEARLIRPANWGLVNWWEDDRRAGAKYINARAESLASRKPFREAFEQRRCLVPADGYFEWVGDKQNRRPFWFHRADGGVFAFAGLYEAARIKGEAERTTTFTIVTVPPNRLMSPIHDRMPAILEDDEAIDEWLYAEQPKARLQELLRPTSEEFLVATPVSQRANSVKNDDPSCLDEAEGDTQGALL